MAFLNKTDEQLMYDMKRGESHAFNEFFKKNFSNLRIFLRGIGLQDTQQCEEIAQDALLDFYLGYIVGPKTFDFDKGKIFSLLCQISKNKFLNIIRQPKKPINDSEDVLGSLYEEFYYTAEETFSRDITLSVVVSFIRNSKCFSIRCFKLFSLDYANLEVDNFEKKEEDLVYNYLRHEHKKKDSELALEMTRWSDRNETPPTIFNESLIRTSRNRCKERLKSNILEAGYVW
jgi:hypothetical protein